MDMESLTSKPDRALIVVLVVTAVLIAVSLVVVFVRGTPALLDPGTPEGVVQRYSAAVLSGYESEAADYLTPAAKEGCGDDFEEAWTGIGRVTLVSTTERDGSADVRVSIFTNYGGTLFEGSEDAESATFKLVKMGAEWRIDTAPWPLVICPE
jgi:hypothetical protein